MVKKTQEQIVLEELEANRELGITAWDMIIKHRITRLASCICRLKKAGYTIDSELQTRDGKVFSRYWLKEAE